MHKIIVKGRISVETTASEEVRHTRIRLGMTILEFSQHLGVSQSIVPKWENGSRIPRPDMLKRIRIMGSDSSWRVADMRQSFAAFSQQWRSAVNGLIMAGHMDQYARLMQLGDSIDTITELLDQTTDSSPNQDARHNAERRFQFIARLIPSLEFATSRNRTVNPTAILAEAGDDPVLADLVKRYQTIDASSHQSIHQDIIATGHELLAIAPDAPGVAEMIARSEQETR